MRSQIRMPEVNVYACLPKNNRRNGENGNNKICMHYNTMWRRRMKENKKKLGDEIVINKTKILTFNLLEIRMDRLNALLLFLMRGLLSDSISRESLHSPNSNCRFFLLFRSFVCVCVYVSKINNGMCFTFALIVFDSSSFFFFTLLFGRFIFDSSLSLSLYHLSFNLCLFHKNTLRLFFLFRFFFRLWFYSHTARHTKVKS